MCLDENIRAVKEVMYVHTLRRNNVEQLKKHALKQYLMI